MTQRPHVEGVRVLRGRDWEEGEADGGEGHLGTVQASPGNGVVHVLWDTGRESTCRAGQGGKFDLRVFDTATVGVHHDNTICLACGEQDIYGVLWRCKDCPRCDLCSVCYADDKHDLRHQFLRIVFPGDPGKLMKKRKVSVRIRAMGLFPGAKVTRGKDWEWKNQDGGPGSEGELLEIFNQATTRGKRNLAKVRWPSGKSNFYRLAYEGHVDITCTDEEAGGFYYRDHLPCLDMADFTTLRTSETPTEKTNVGDGVSSSPDPKDDVPQQTTSPADEVPQQATPAPDDLPQQTTPPHDDVPQQATPPADDVPQQTTPTPEDVPQQATPTPDDVSQQATPPVDEVLQQATPTPDDVPLQTTPPADALLRLAAPPTTPLEHSTPEVQAEDSKDQDSSHSKSSWPDKEGEDSSDPPGLSSDNGEGKPTTVTAASLDLSSEGSVESPTRLPLTPHSEVCLHGQKTDPGTSEDSDQRLRPESKTQDQRSEPGALEDPAVQKLLVEPEEEPKESTDSSEVDSLHAAQARSDSKPEDGRADGADVEDDPRKITTGSAAPSPAGELPPSPTTALSSSTPGTGDCLQTTPASTPEATQDSGFEEHGGAGDSRSTDTTEGSDEADSVSDTAASLDEQTTSPQDVTVWPASGPAAGHETDRQATASDTATAEKDSSTESQDSPASLDPRAANEVSGGGACLHDSSAVALTTAVTTETGEKQPTGSSDSAVTQDSTLRPETQASTQSPMRTATGQDDDDRTTNRLSGLDKEAATGTDLQTETQIVEATTPEEDGLEHKTSQSAVAAQAGDGQLSDAGDGQLPDAGNGQLLDAGDGQLSDLGDGQLRDAGDGQLRDAGDGQLRDAGDGQLPDAGDSQLSDLGDGQLPDAGDGQLRDAGDGQLRDAGDGQLPDAGDSQLSDLGDGQLRDAGDGQLRDAGDGQLPDAGDSQLSDLGDGQLRDAGDGQLRDAGDGQLPDAGDSQLSDLGDGQLPDAGDGQLPETGDGQLREAGDGQLREAGDGQLRDAGDGQLPDAGDGQLRDAGDGQLRDAEDGQLPDAGDGQLRDAGDGQLRDAGDGQLPDAGGSQLSDAGDSQLRDVGDDQHLDSGDGQLPDAGDGQLPDAGDGQLRDAGDGQLPDADGQLSDAGGLQLPDAGDGQLRDAGDGLPLDPTGATSSAESEEREADAASERPPGPTGPAMVEVELGAAAAAATAPEQRDAVPTDGAHAPENVQETSSFQEGEIISSVAEADRKPEDGFRVGDRAAIGVPPDTLVELQQNFGGVTHSMLKKIGQVGVVTRVRPPGTVGLRLGKVVFRMNPVALLLVHQHSTGDKVLIRDDLYQLRVLNDRLGWNSGMDRTAGKIGEVTKVDSDGDLTVSFGHRSYMYSPSCCLPAPPGSSVEELSHRGARAVGNNGTESVLGLSSMSERLAGLLSGATGGRGHRIRLGDLAQLSSLGDLSQLGSLGDLSQLSSLSEQLGEHLSQLRQLTGMGGLGVVTGDESTEEGRLQMAIIAGDVDKVKEMCRANTALLSSVHNGLTPLMLASHQGKRKVALALLDLGADVNGMGVKQQTALGAALEEKEEEMAMLLLEKGADPRHKNGKERTPLHMAVFNRLNEVAQIIIHMGADINAQDKYGDTPLHDAIARQNTAMVDLLLQLDNINVRLVNRKGYTPLQLACRVQNTEVVGLLLALDNTNVNQLKEQDFAALHICVTHKYLDGVRLLITNGNADVNLPSGRQGLTALHVACLHAHVDIVESLLELGAKVNVHDHNGETPLHVAMGGYDGKEKSSEERERAVQARIRAACLLITNGAFVDAENKKGRPPTTYGPSEVQIGVAQFIDQNPHLVRRKGQSGGATSGGAKQSLIMTSLQKVSLPCRQCQKESDVTLRPCGHRVVCATCALTVKFCPLCGTVVTRCQGEKDHTLAAKRPTTAEGSQASDPHLSKPGSTSNPHPSLPGSTSDPDVSRPGSRLDSTVDTQAPAKRNGQSVEATPAAESISEVTVTAGRSPDAVDQVQGLTSDTQLEKPSADPSEDQPMTSSTDLSPKQPVTTSTDLSPNLPENPSAAHLPWSITAGAQARPSVDATAAQQATPLSADGHDTPPRNVTLSEQAPPPPNVTASGQAPPPLNVSASGQAPPPLSVTASGQAPPPLNVTASGQAPPPLNVSASGQASPLLSVTASGQAPPPLNVTASGQAPPPLNVSASGQASPPLSVTASGQAPPPLNVTASGQAPPPLNVSASGQAPPPLSVTASGQAPPPLNVTASGQAPPPFNVSASGQAPPPLSVTASGQAPPPLNVTASGQAPPPLNVTVSGQAPPPLNVTASGQARPPWDITVGAQARPPHNVTASGQARPPWNTESVADRGGLPWADSPKPVRDELGDSLKPDGVNHTTSGCKPKVFDRDDDDFVLPDLPSVPAGGGWVVMGPGGPFDLNGSSALPGGAASHEKPRVDPWSFSDQQASGSVLAAIGEGRGNVSQVGVGAEARGRASQASAGTKGRGNTSRTNVWEEGTGSASRVSVWEKGRGNMSEFSPRGGWEETASSQICLGATGTASRAGSREDRRRDMAQLSMREDRRRDMAQLNMREDRRRDVPQLSMREDRRRDVPQLSTREGGWWDAPHVSARQQRGSNTPVVKTKAEERKDTSALSAVDRDPKELSDLNSQGLQAGLHFEKKSATNEEKKEVARPPSPSHKASPDDSSSPEAEAQRQVQSPVPKEGAASTVSSDSAPSTSSASDKCGEGNKPETSLTPDAAAPVARPEATEPTGGGLNTVVHNVKTYFQADNLAAILGSVARSDGQKPRSAGSPRETEPRHTNTTATDISKSLLTDDASKTQSEIQKSDGPNPQTGISSFGARPPKGETTVRDAVQSADDSDEVNEGDRVVIRVSEERLVELQREYGGTTKGMLQCVGRTGTVTGRTARGAICVKFSSLSYRFNPHALLKVHVHNSGDTVRVLRDLDLVKLLNKRVGYCPALAETLGKVGTITKIDDDYDITVKFGQSSFRYSPACCVPAPGATPDTVTATAGGEGEVVNHSRDEASSDRQAFMKRLAQMVKEGTTVSKVMGTSEGDSSAISRLFTAIRDGNSQLVKEMCQNDPSLISKTHEGRMLTPLMYASWKGQIGIVRELLDMGADVNGSVTGGVHDSRSAVSAALESGEEETAVLLLQRGADPMRRTASRHRTPLHMAAAGNHVQVLQVLLQMDVDVNAKDVFGDTPLIDALLNDSRATVDILLGLDHVDVTVVNHKGITPLHAACLRSIPSAVEQILTRDTSHVNRLMGGEYAPLHLAANDDCVENIRLLLNSGADVNMVAGGDHEGNRPIHHACLNGHLPSVEVLLDFGAEVNVANKTGDTPLHFAIGGRIPKEVAGQASELFFQEERVRIACTLISNGAFVDAEDSKGRTCMRYGGPEIQAAVQDFMDRNRQLVRKKGKGGSGGEARPTLVLRGVPLPCALCKSSMSDVTLLPCGHKTACSKCAGALAVCPLCQCRVDSTTTDDQKGALFEAISHAW